MRILSLASLFVIASAGLAAELVVGAGSTVAAIPAPAGLVIPQSRPRLSSEIVASLAGEAAKAAPAVAVPPASESIAAPLNPIVAERARGEVVRMAPYTVSSPGMKMPAEKQVFTPKGRLDAAHKRRPGLKFFSFWGLNDSVAEAMLEEERVPAQRREEAEL